MADPATWNQLLADTGGETFSERSQQRFRKRLNRKEDIMDVDRSEVSQVFRSNVAS